jgi:hypothetical protein
MEAASSSEISRLYAYVHDVMSRKAWILHEYLCDNL